jgi:hypothetical protein
MKKAKERFFTTQRVFALFLMITAAVQILNSVSAAQWKDQVSTILQTRHPYFSDTVSDTASAISALWWCIIFFGSLLLFIDKNLLTFFDKGFKEKR